MAIPEDRPVVPRQEGAEAGAGEAPFFGIYNWSLYLSQAGFLLLLLIFSILFAFTLRSFPFVLAVFLTGGVALVHGLLLWREDRLALANFASGVARRVSDLMEKPAGEVLDAGCGLGRTLIGLLRQRPELRVMAVDIWDNGQILGNSDRQLLRNLKAAGVADRAAIQQGDVRNLPFEDETFDYVLAIWVLHELSVPDQRVALSEIARVIRPSGKIIVVEYVQSLRNFLVFGLINWHYDSLPHWLDLASEMGLTVERRELSQGIAYLVLRT
jgi:SAM-dependent methyltransferase